VEQLLEVIGNHVILVSAFLLVSMLLLWSLLGGALQGVKILPPDEVVRLINYENALLFDVRGSAEYDAGHILRAVHATPESLLGKALGMESDKSRWIVVCGQGAADATHAARPLVRQQYRNVVCLRGGMLAWKEAGLPLVRK